MVSRVCLRFMFRKREIQSRFIKNKVHRIKKLLFSLFYSSFCKKIVRFKPP